MKLHNLALDMFPGTDPQLAEALSIRQEVFVEEQGVDPMLEIDDYDYIAWHVLARVGGTPVGTARLVTVDAYVAKIGRVAVLPDYRGRGIASAMVQLVSEYAKRESRNTLVLDSQLTAMPLYERLGFVAEGEPFLDAGIIHRRMVKKL